MARKISFDLPDTDVEPSPSVTPSPANSRTRPLLGMNRPIVQTGALGAISQSLDGINDRVRRAEEIEQKLINGQTIVEIDPALVDNSFVPDRMESTEEQNRAFRELIREHGQNVPILVRPKAGSDGRYEVAFGHRRLRAARELGIRVRAVIRPLTDDELVIAQGQENSGRTDLTFIERASFAARLEERKFGRDVIMAALNIDKAALSRLIAVATRIPTDIVNAIGSAPSFGRVRWQELIDLLEQEGNRERASLLVQEPSYQQLPTDSRFEFLVSSLRTRPVRPGAEVWSAADGTVAAKISRNGKKLSLVFDDRATPQFGEFVRERLQSLFHEYRQGGKGR